MLVMATCAEALAGEAGRKPCVAALGTFDGVHRGHVAILETAVALAAELGVQALALTFDRLPLEVLHSAQAPPRLSTSRRRLALLQQYIPEVIAIRFDAELAALSPEGFIKGLLIAGLGCVGAVAGFNFTFGRGKSGTAATLRASGAAAGLQTRIVEPVLAAGQQVSSTLIREYVRQGQVDQAQLCLGRPYSLEGTVAAGAGVGRRLGFPTANLAIAPGIAVPADGVYLTEVYLLPDRRSLGPALTAIGARPTFKGEDRTVEAHILDYASDLYGAAIEVAFHSRLRDIIAFAGPGELQAQIKADVEEARRRWAKLTV